MKTCIFSLDGRQSRGLSPISYVPWSIFACGWVVCAAHPQNNFQQTYTLCWRVQLEKFAIFSEANDVKEEDGWYRDDAADWRVRWLWFEKPQTCFATPASPPSQ